MKRRHLKIGRDERPAVLDEGQDYQDFEGAYVEFPDIKRRVRIFPMPANMDRDRKDRLRRAVHREFALLSVIQHPSIDVPRDLDDGQRRGADRLLRGGPR